MLAAFPVRPFRPRKNGPPYDESELVGVDQSDGMRHLNTAPVEGAFQVGKPRRSNSDDAIDCYLWVIDERGIPSISEAPLKRIGPGRLHHTNLTGGGDASVGGELWFETADALYVDGSSGRYPPSSPAHLAHAVRLFEAAGFTVNSLGWDEETDQAFRFLRENGRDRS